MSSVKFKRPIVKTPNKNLIFELVDNELLSQEITLKFDIELNDEVQKPIKLIKLYIEVFHPQYCYIKNYGKMIIKNYHNRHENFTTNNIKFKIGIVDKTSPLDKLIKLKIYIRDASKLHEIFPMGVAKNHTWIPSRAILDLETTTPAINNFL